MKTALDVFMEFNISPERYWLLIILFSIIIYLEYKFITKWSSDISFHIWAKGGMIKIIKNLCKR